MQGEGGLGFIHLLFTGPMAGPTLVLIYFYQASQLPVIRAIHGVYRIDRKYEKISI